MVNLTRTLPPAECRPGEHTACNCDLVLIWAPAPDPDTTEPDTDPTGGERRGASEMR